MKPRVLITAIGEDRPGIVSRLTEVLVEHGANLEDSRMALLGGEFAAIMLASMAEDRLEALKQDLLRLESESITVTVKAAAPAKLDHLKGYLPYELSVTGADHEGIVHKISSYLRDLSVNIQSMQTAVVNAPETGTPLFSMRAHLQVPPSIAVAELRTSLSAIGDRESVDIEVRAPH